MDHYHYHHHYPEKNCNENCCGHGVMGGLALDHDDQGLPSFDVDRIRRFHVQNYPHHHHHHHHHHHGNYHDQYLVTMVVVVVHQNLIYVQHLLQLQPRQMH